MMKKRAAFLAGVIAGAAMTIIMAVARLAGMRIHFEMMLGTMLGGEPSIAKWAVGLIIHVTLSGMIALFYGFGFEHLTHRAGALVGIAFSTLHAAAAGIVIGFVPNLNPIIPEIMPAPGFFMFNGGAAYVATFVLLHLVYGAVVGVMYGPVIFKASRKES